MKMARLALLVLLIVATTQAVLAQDAVVWDSSGNNLLNGTYNFREVMWSNQGDLHRVAIYGSIQFDGNGGYALSSTVMDSNVGTPQTFSTTGAYRISASGMGYMDDPIRLSAASPSSTVWGLVTQNVFVGSSTDDGINNLFIAAQAPSSPPNNASFHDTYWAAGVNIPSGNVNEARDMLIRLNPDGLGNLGTVNITGSVGTAGQIAQTVNGAAYSFSNGAFTLGFGGSLPLDAQTLVAGDASCYLTADGNFFFGGSRNGWDMIVGVRALTGPLPAGVFSGIYYQAGADVTPSKGFQTLSTYYGAFSALSDSGILIGHQRILPGDSTVQFKPYDFTYSDTVALAPDGTYDDFLHFHHVTAGAEPTPFSIHIPGLVQIGVGTGSHLGINVALRAPGFFGPPGAHLAPAGISNAASSTPFTVGVSRGGFIALYGANLAPSDVPADASMPTTLGGVQVLINGRPAPLYFVRSDVVLAIVPFATSGTVASVQVLNNGFNSETRTVRVKTGTPGIFTNLPSGIGSAIALHVQNNSNTLVTAENPAHPGETILVYLAGLGDVNPPVADGTPAPSTPFSSAVIPPVVLVDGNLAQVGIAGLWPGAIGVYGMTVTIPTGTRSGNVFLDVSLPDSYTTEAQIPIGAGTAVSQSLETLGVAPAPKRPAVGIPGTLRRFPDRP